MINILWIDLLINKLFGIPSYLYIGFLNNKSRDKMIFLISICIYSIYFFPSDFFNITIVIFIALINNYLNKQLDYKIIIFIDYFLYFLIMNLIYQRLSIINGLTNIIFFSVVSCIINHIIRKKS